MVSINISSEADSNWNKRLFDSELGTNRQVVETGIRFEQVNKKPYFITFEDNTGQIIGQLLISTFDRFSKKSSTKKFLGKLSGKSQTICQWEYGPAIFETNHSEQIYEKLGEFFKSKNFFVTGWQHPFMTQGISVLNKKFQLIPWSTFIIDLTKPLDVLFQQINKKSGRKNIERAQQRGVVIEEINENNLSEFLELRNVMKKNEGLELNTIENFSQWWNLMKPLGLSGFLARKEEKPIGGLLFSSVNNHIIEIAVARSPVDTSEKLYSQDLIKWKIIEWGSKNGLKFYNLAGVNPNPTTSKELGIYNYKKKWGGTQYDYFGLKSL